MGKGISRPASDVRTWLNLMTIQQRLADGHPLWLFLDYDGTLVPIARTPEEAKPDAPLLDLISRLAQIKTWRMAILSGRSLDSLNGMFSMPQLILAGIYGVEIKIDGQVITRVAEPGKVRKRIQEIKTEWAQMISGANGIWIEDKGLALAMHARFADSNTADSLLPQARRIVETPSINGFRIIGGDRFLEVAPAAANKAATVEWLLDRAQVVNALPVYFGDDDKDEEAFAVIRRRGGIPIAVGNKIGDKTNALEKLDSPNQVRAWLNRILDETHSSIV